MRRAEARREFLGQTGQHWIVDSHLAQMLMRLQHVSQILARLPRPLRTSLSSSGGGNLPAYCRCRRSAT